MDIRKLLLAPHTITITALTMAVALALPCAVQAVSAGVIVQQNTNLSSKNTSSPSPDDPRSLQISAEERASLLAKLKKLEDELRDAKSQVNLQLAQIQQWLGELAEIKSQLAQLDAVSPTAAASITTPPSAKAQSPVNVPLATQTPVQTPPPATASPQEKRPGPSTTVKPAVEQQDSPYLQQGLFAALGLLLALALWMGRRYYTKIKSPGGEKSKMEAEPAPESAHHLAQQDLVSSAVTELASQAQLTCSEQAFVPSPKPGTAGNFPTFSSPDPSIIQKEGGADDLLLEEAKLYISQGHMAMAVEILKDLNKRHPENDEVWSLLLSSYSSLSDTVDFEESARKFLIRHKDGSPLWSGIQALGRTFEKDNPLYSDTTASLPPETAARHQPIGALLLEMGIMSENDLHHLLNDFDPKKDGRFGGYLVKRKIITLTQLDEALLQQQGIGGEAHPDHLPSLHELEDFMADFDPKKYASIGAFLASRNASTPEQLRQLLQQQTDSHETAEPHHD
ncbi:MAG: hypothetical protein HY306_03780 [Nitrosomonadales bacterium]|nr:hypothetical protein [Nitrosomonadales bacterium]